MVVTPNDELSVANSQQPQGIQVATPTNCNPPWKRPTRPCPFYSQGQCLFSDSCSFLHEVKIKVRRASDVHLQDVHDESPVYGTPPLLTGFTTPSSTSSRSPNRSPRMTSLLLALKDVIGDETDTGEVDRQLEVVDQGGKCGHGIQEDTVLVKGQVVPKHNEEGGSESHAQTIGETVSNISSSSDEVTDESSSKGEEGYQNLDAPYLPHRNKDSECPPQREDSIDSGYSEGFKAPSSMHIPLSPTRPSTLNLLSSPFGSPSVRVFYPKTVRRSMFSPSFPSSFFDAAPSLAELHNHSNYFDTRHSDGPEIIHSAPAAVVTGGSEDSEFSSHEREESGSCSSSSLSSLDTLSSPPLDAAAILTSQEASSIATVTGGEPTLQRPRASSELTIVARNLDDEPQSPHQSSGTNDIEDEPLNSLYELYDSSHLFSPPVVPLNFSRPSSTTSFHEPLSPQVSPIQERSFGNAGTFPTQSDGASEESPSPKVPFGFRHSQRPDGTRLSVRPKPPPLSHQSLNSSLGPPDLHGQPLPSPSSLRPFRLSAVLSSSVLRGKSPSDIPYVPPPSPSVSSDYSIGSNPLLSSTRSSSTIPEHVRHTLVSANDLSPLLLSGLEHTHELSNFTSPTSTPAPQSPILNQSLQSMINYRHSPPHVQNGNHNRTSSRLSASYSPDDYVEEDNSSDKHGYDEIIRNSRTTSIRRVPVPVIDDDGPQTAPVPRAASAMSRYTHVHSIDQEPHTAPISFSKSLIHAIATPRPTLMFAIASDSVEKVECVLKRGEADPNDQVGPQSALEFTLTNGQLINKMEIVKTLLAYGADPSTLRAPRSTPPRLRNISLREDEEKYPYADELKSKMDPATRYFVSRADAAHTRRTSALIQRSFFRPLTRLRYDVIGQDCAFEQLFRVLSMHSQNLSVAPVIVLFCGPPGVGKSLLARKFGFILDVPTHTVNMTTLKSTHDLWQSYSMNPHEETSTQTLAEFLVENENKRCVVVLDEMDKVADERTLWSLLMPWELGRCSFEAGRRHVSVRNVIWLGTTNIGHELVFEHLSQRTDPDYPMDRQEYVRLVEMFRPYVSKCLGPSLLSRVTTVLPFVPFTDEEKMAIATQALFSLGGEIARSMSAEAVENFVSKVLNSYLAPEGARSLYRAVSTQLLDALDSV